MYVVAKSHLKVYLAMTCSKVSSALQDISIGDGASMYWLDLVFGHYRPYLQSLHTSADLCK